jgi:benzoyl-CoA reductase subunit C
MMKFFDDVEKSIQHKPLKEWVESGKKVVGYTCSFMPPEIYHAADILPYRMRGIETESMEFGDEFYGPFSCSFPKCLLQLIGEGKYNFLDGAVVTSGCDSMRRLDDNWRAAGREHGNVIPDFFHYFDMPFKTASFSQDWFTNEIRKLIKLTEAHFNVSITEDKIKQSIEVYNEGRRMLGELEQFRNSDKVFISGTDVYSVFVAATVLPRELFNQELKKLLTSLKKKKKSILNGGKRIMVSGSICDDKDLINLVEEDGAIVVAENICFGIRSATDQVSLDGDPAIALTQRYMNDSVCPRFMLAYKTRLEYLKEKAKNAKVDGIIFENVRFCDLHGSENALLERDFDDIGIPAMRLEREHGPMSDTGRMRMRIEAFLEKI